jgi:hypothetical protein
MAIHLESNLERVSTPAIQLFGGQELFKLGTPILDG